MLRRIFLNTAVTAGAFSVSGVVGILLVPVLIRTYGAAEFGLIVLARTLMPTAGIGLLDFGISEIATLAIATARADGDWKCAAARLRTLLRATLSLSLLIGIAICVAAPVFATWMGVDGPHKLSFVTVVRVTGALLPLLFAGLLYEGVLKGFEAFLRLRTIDVTALLTYAAAVVYGAYGDSTYSWVAYAFLASQAGKSIAVIMGARSSLPAEFHNEAISGREGRAFVLERGRLLLFSRIQGALQYQTAPLLIGALVGPSGVGIYDALTRLPRFVKSVLSILNTTLFPVASRLHASGDRTRLRYLGEFALATLPALVLPPLAIVALFSSDILTLWLGREFAVHGPWLALYWVVPAFNTVLSFQNVTLLSRSDFLRANNRISLFQTVLQLSLSVALARFLGQGAFILGQVAALVIVFWLQVRLGAGFLGLPALRISRFLLFAVILMGFVAAIYLLLPQPAFTSLWSMLAGLAGGSLLAWGASLCWFLTEADRRGLQRILMIIGRRQAAQ